VHPSRFFCSGWWIVGFGGHKKIVSHSGEL
jgi:hypothetical protein